MSEEAKQRVNGVRRSARKELDDLSDDGGVSEDDVQRAEGRLDGLKDEFIGMIDTAQAQKEEELLEV
jgi:ribosome recycling factor